MHFKRTVTGALFAGALLLGASGLVWACSPQATITISPNSGPVGTRTSVRNSAFNPGPVEIRWDGVDGPQMGSGQSGSPIDVTIPSDASGGAHYIVALQRDPSGEISRRAATVFEVVSATSGSSQPSTGTGTAPSTAQSSGKTTRTLSGGGSEATQQQTAPADTQPQSPQGSAPVTEAAASSPAAAPASTQSGGASPASGATQPQPAPANQTQREPAASSSVGPDRPVTSVPGAASSAPAAAAGAPREQGAPDPAVVSTPAQSEAPSPLSATVQSDVWSGFETPFGSQPQHGSFGEQTEGTSASTAVGAGLLAIGLTALVAGFGVARLGGSSRQAGIPSVSPNRSASRGGASS